MIASDSQQYVYITEAIGARVQAISPANRWAGGISSFGVELGQLYRPKGIAIDGKGRLFVSDSTLQVVQAFDSSGAIEGVLTDEQHRPLRFEHPMGMCFDSAGKLYVVELKANRVAVVSLIEARLR
jgi:sugar lactone lactonase YvrE